MLLFAPDSSGAVEMCSSILSFCTFYSQHNNALLSVERKLKACSFDLDFPVAPCPIAATLGAALFRAALRTRIVTTIAILDEAIADVLSVGNQQPLLIIECLASRPGKTKSNYFTNFSVKN